MRKPDFFIVGAPRCGTTAMYEYLGQHPDIFMCALKEPHFFCADLPYFHRATDRMDEYLSYFAGATSEKRIGEASVSYLMSRAAPENIRAFTPEAAIIIMLRNPVEMMYSFHSYRVYTGRESTLDFEEALRLEAQRLHGLDGPHRLELFSYREAARHSEHVARYLDVFGPDNVHVVIFDDLLHSPEQVYSATLRFLGVHDDFRPLFAVVNSNGVVFSRAFRSALRRPPAVLRQFARRWMPLPVRYRIGRALRLLNTRKVRRPPLDPILRRQLQAEFAGDVERLSRLLGRDLTHWTRD